jgi:hypothetical protein
MHWQNPHQDVRRRIAAEIFDKPATRPGLATPGHIAEKNACLLLQAAHGYGDDSSKERYGRD